MRRVLSWIVLYFCYAASNGLIRLALDLFFKLIDAIMNAGEVLFWVLVFLFGGSGAGIAFWLIVTFAGISVKVSQKVEYSRTGRRYTVLGILIIAQYVLSLIGLAVGIIVGGSKIYFILACLGMIGYAIAMMVGGKLSVDEDGPPLTKRQRLERKLEKLNEKEIQDGTANIPVNNKMIQTKEPIFTEEDKSYMDYLVREGRGIDEEDAKNIVLIIRSYNMQGKQKAMVEFDKMAKALINRMDPFVAMGKIAFLSGLLIPNGVLTKEECDALTDKYTDYIFEITSAENDS